MEVPQTHQSEALLVTQRQAPIIQTEPKSVALLQSQFTGRLIGTIFKTSVSGTTSDRTFRHSEWHVGVPPTSTVDVFLQLSPSGFSDD